MTCFTVRRITSEMRIVFTLPIAISIIIVLLAPLFVSKITGVFYISHNK